MEVDEILRKAWEAVEKSGVPEPLQEVAFREAVETLRGGAVKGGAKDDTGNTRKRKAKKAGKSATTTATVADVPDEATFFERLSKESGVPETDLRDIFQLGSDGNVHVTQATKDLGDSIAAQARTVAALVAGARSRGLGEQPVTASAVRDEVKRKGCFDENNFAGKSLAPLKGFNVGSKRTEIVTTSKWVADFKAAVDQALGRNKLKGDK